MPATIATEQTANRQPGTTTTHTSKQTDHFFPSGAIAFFIALVILCLIIWFGIYFLMIGRI